MRGKQHTDGENFQSSMGLTILPGKGNAKAKGTGKTAAQQPVAPQFFPAPETPLTPAQLAPPTAPAVAPVAAPVAPAMATSGVQTADAYPTASPAAYPPAYPAAPGFPPQPLYTEAPTGQPGYGQPGVPPAGYTPINFLDDHEPHDGPAHERPKSRTPLLLAAVLVVALAGGAYYEVPKLLDHKKSSATTTTLLPKPAAAGGTLTLPATLGSLAKQPATDATAAGLATVRKADPALANVQVGLYGPATTILVMAGNLPASVAANTPAQQVALIKRINAALPTDGGAARNLAAVPQAAGAGEFWCALQPATDGSAASTDCIAVDSKAVVMVTIVGPDEAANVHRAMTVRGLVEHP